MNWAVCHKPMLCNTNYGSVSWFGEKCTMGCRSVSWIGQCTMDWAVYHGLGQASTRIGPLWNMDTDSVNTIIGQQTFKCKCEQNSHSNLTWSLYHHNAVLKDAFSQLWSRGEHVFCYAFRSSAHETTSRCQSGSFFARMAAENYPLGWYFRSVWPEGGRLLYCPCVTSEH